MTDWKPEGWHSVAPRLVAQDESKLVDFLRSAFGATGDFHSERPSELRIGDSIVMVSGAAAREARRAFLYLYVPDVDAVYAEALRLGARSIEEPFATPYGDRRGMVEDPGGNVWQIATRRSATPAPALAYGVILKRFE